MVGYPAQIEPDSEHKERHENESGAVKTECAEVVKPTLCLVAMGGIANYQSSNQLQAGSSTRAFIAWKS